MSTIPDENRPGSGDPASADPDSHTGHAEWLEWLKQASTTAGDFFKLLFAELGLAMSDAKRIAVLGLATVFVEPRWGITSFAVAALLGIASLTRR